MFKKYIDKNAVKLIKLIQSNGNKAYLVGGCVRDMMMGVKPHDFDICTNAEPYSILVLLSKHNIRYTTIGITFGTVVAHINSNEYEITTFRTDTQTSMKHRPDEVKFTTSIEDDLARRDFTINAMAYDPIEDNLIDLFGGKADIENKVIKAVREPNTRIQEDPLRILRALRFSIVLGFDIEDSTFDAMISNKELLDNLSKERITSELRKILTSGKEIKQHFLKCSDIIVQIIPEMKPCVGFNQNNRYHTHNVYEHILYVVDYCKTNDFEIKLAALLHDIGKPKAYVVGPDGYGHFYGHEGISAEIAVLAMVKNLRLTADEELHIATLIKYHDMELMETTKSLKKAISKVGKELMEKWFILKQADRDDHIYPDNRHAQNLPRLNEIYHEVLKEKPCFKVTDIEISGNDIMDILCIKPGRQVGYILNKLKDEVLSEELENDHEKLMARTLEISKTEEFINAKA